MPAASSNPCIKYSFPPYTLISKFESRCKVVGGNEDLRLATRGSIVIGLDASIGTSLDC